MENHVTSVTHVIQLAVAPVFLLTAIATLISALNVRLGRIVDRQRVLLDDGQAHLAHAAYAGIPSDATVSSKHHRELALLSRRVHLSYLSILTAVIAGLLVCVVIASAFVGVLLEADLAKLLAALFILAMLLLIASLGLFVREIYLAVSGRTRFDPPEAGAGAADGVTP